jgi:NAD+ kinase
MKRIGVLYHPMIDGAKDLAEKLQKFLESTGVSVWLGSAWEEKGLRAEVDDADLILAIGGDGTILRAVQAAIPGTTPVTGINLGRLGFLAELSVDEAQDKLLDLMAGKGWIDKRTMLEAELASPGKKGRTKFHALNDVVVGRGVIARVVYVDASVDGEPLTTYKGDGVIVATATGSTGYSLAAGGPILHPQARELLLLPILPHLSPDYAMVLPSTAVVTLHLNATHEAILNVDGHMTLPLSDGAIITVKRSPNLARFLRIHTESSFYGSLERRLKGRR